MNTYVTLTSIWHQGVEYPKGSELQLTEVGAKYLGHGLVLKSDMVVAEALFETKVLESAPAPTAKRDGKS